MSGLGPISPPGDKSMTHRAFLIAGLRRDTTEIISPLVSGDTRSTSRVLRQLGVQVSPLRQDHPARVVGARWQQPGKVLQCGNSGTTARLLLGALAAHGFEARVDGDASLRRRPMRRVTEPLTEMGALFTGESEGTLPLSIIGGELRSIDYTSPVASAQVKSAVLLAGLTSGVSVSVVEPAKSRDHTERLLRYLGADILVEGLRVELKATRDVVRARGPIELEIPGDPSAAAFLIGAVILAGIGEALIEGVCVNPTRTGFLSVLERMGASVKVENSRDSCGEPVGDIVARATDLRGTEVTADEIPAVIDELPLLAVLAARAAGETVFRSVGELRVKESNRLDSLAVNLNRLGVGAEVSGDDLLITGTDKPLEGRVETMGDHRISMAFAVLGTDPRVDLDLSETASTGISYPRFFEDLQMVRKYG